MQEMISDDSPRGEGRLSSTQVWIDVYGHVRGLTRCFAVFENASGKSLLVEVTLKMYLVRSHGGLSKYIVKSMKTQN